MRSSAYRSPLRFSLCTRAHTGRQRVLLPAGTFFMNKQLLELSRVQLRQILILGLHRGPDGAKANACAQAMTRVPLVWPRDQRDPRPAWVCDLKKRGRQNGEWQARWKPQLRRPHKLSKQAPIMGGHSTGLARWLSSYGCWLPSPMTRVQFLRPALVRCRPTSTPTLKHT